MTAFWKGHSGNAAVEFAMVCPVFLVMLLGIMSYGGYFWMAHSLQELANDSARAALAGLTSDERQTLAQSTLASEIKSYGTLDPCAAIATYTGDAQGYTVSISYDASKSNGVFWATADLVPMPSSTIVRSASIKLGGF
jgi:Flp pilus assembly protein TadG